MNTEEQFYWLGFMYADGNISKEGNRVEIRLSLKDKDHFLQLTTEIRIGETNGIKFCHLSVRNKHLWNTLNRLGCVPQKSLTLAFPNLKLFKNTVNILHFIRGYVDGCLTISKDGDKLRTRLTIVGTKSFLTSINCLFSNKGYIRNKSTENYTNQAFELKFSDIPSRRLARYLYENATIYLDRKYEKFLEFCRLEEESSRRLSSNIGEDCDVNPEINSEIAKGFGLS